MKKKWVVPMVLSVAMISAPLVSNGQVVTGKDVGLIQQKMHKQGHGAKQLNVPIFVKQKKLEHTNTKDAKNFLGKNKEIFDMGNGKANGDFKVKQTKKDKLGMKHVRMQQTVDRIPVEGSEVIVHYSESDQVQSVNGNYNNALNEADLSTKPSISKEQALETAKEKVAAPETLPYEPTSELVIYPYQDENHLPTRQM